MNSYVYLNEDSSFSKDCCPEGYVNPILDVPVLYEVPGHTADTSQWCQETLRVPDASQYCLESVHISAKVENLMGETVSLWEEMFDLTDVITNHAHSYYNVIDETLVVLKWRGLRHRMSMSRSCVVAMQVAFKSWGTVFHTEQLSDLTVDNELEHCGDYVGPSMLNMEYAPRNLGGDFYGPTTVHALDLRGTHISTVNRGGYLSCHSFVTSEYLTELPCFTNITNLWLHNNTVMNIVQLWGVRTLHIGYVTARYYEGGDSLEQVHVATSSDTRELSTTLGYVQEAAEALYRADLSSILEMDESAVTFMFEIAIIRKRIREG